VIDVIVLAGGAGERAGTAKQFSLFGGKTALEQVCDRVFEAGLEPTMIVAPEDQLHFVADLTGIPAVEGGSTRQESVANGLLFCEGERVMVVEAARPWISAKLIRQLAASSSPAASLAVTPVDAVFIGMHVSKAQVRLVQTPQVFDRRLLTGAYALADRDYDVCSQLVESVTGVAPMLIEGDHRNIKVTFPWDLELPWP
jgi:2-C-methyl-D-erythritol 4-phosphate cytidylyltransferase